MNMHVGARGSEKMMEHFQDMLKLAIQDPDNLEDAIREIRRYAYTVEVEGNPKVLGGRTEDDGGGATKKDPLGIR
jgi:hypothetical protein